MAKKDSTVVNFYTGGAEGQPVRTAYVERLIPNVVAGQRFNFDHTQMAKCLWGTVKEISHVLDLDGEVTTYIDVELT